jgi:hypothetical protein
MLSLSKHGVGFFNGLLGGGGWGLPADDPASCASRRDEKAESARDRSSAP